MCCAVTCAGQHGHLCWSPWRQNISRKHAKIFGNAKWNRKLVCYITFKDKPFFDPFELVNSQHQAHFVDIWRTVEMEYNYHLSINFCDTYFMSCFYSLAYLRMNLESLKIQEKESQVRVDDGLYVRPFLQMWKGKAFLNTVFARLKNAFRFLFLVGPDARDWLSRQQLWFGMSPDLAPPHT